MSRVLFAWELGSGVGHLAPFRPVADALIARGHDVVLAAKDVQGASTVFGAAAVRVVQAPLCLKRYGGLQNPPLNYAEILMRFGYLDAPQLRGMVRAWADLLALARPDVLVVDHAPTALLAARGSGLPAIAFGNPFFVPPSGAPTPNMRPWLDVPQQRLAGSDASVLAAIGEATGAPLATLGALFDGVVPFFFGTPELDPYGARDAAQYMGLLVGASGGASPRWPAGDGPRVFAYLKADYRHIDAALHALGASGARCMAYVAGATAELIARHQGPRLAFSDGYVDIARAVTECDLGSCHTGLGTVVALLRGGKPLFLLPYNLDQILIARNVEKLGAGRWVDGEAAAPDFAGTLAALLSDPAHGVAARAYAARHGDRPVSAIVDDVASRIESAAASR